MLNKNCYSDQATTLSRSLSLSLMQMEYKRKRNHILFQGALNREARLSFAKKMGQRTYLQRSTGLVYVHMVCRKRFVFETLSYVRETQPLWQLAQEQD